MEDKDYIFDNFRKSYSIKDKYYDLGSYMKVDKYGNYTSTFEDFIGYYKADKSKKQEETPQERESRLLREKAEAREVKIDQILKK
jgi:hypothetical protein